MNEIDKRLLNDFQRDFPLTSRPYAEIAKTLGISEDEVLARLTALSASGAISRVGPVIRPRTIGVSTLAAMRVPPARLVETAERVSAHPAVNHNYEREHDLNLWFVVTAESGPELQRALNAIEDDAGFTVYSFPMLEDYHIDLGFRLPW